MTPPECTWRRAGTPRHALRRAGVERIARAAGARKRATAASAMCPATATRAVGVTAGVRRAVRRATRWLTWLRWWRWPRPAIALRVRRAGPRHRGRESRSQFPPQFTARGTPRWLANEGRSGLRLHAHEPPRRLVRFRYSCNHFSGLTRKRHQSRVETMLAWSLHGKVGSRVGCLPRRALFPGDPLGNSPPPSLGGVHVGLAEASYDAAVSDPRGASPTAPRVPSLAAALRHTRMVAAAQRSRSRGFRRFTDDFTREGFPLAGGGPPQATRKTRYLNDSS